MDALIPFSLLGIIAALALLGVRELVAEVRMAIGRAP